MVLFNGDEDKSLAYLQHHSSQMPRPALFGLLKERSPGLMKRVIRAGADELLFLPLDPGRSYPRAAESQREPRPRRAARRRQRDFAGQYRGRSRRQLDCRQPGAGVALQTRQTRRAARPRFANRRARGAAQPRARVHHHAALPAGEKTRLDSARSGADQASLQASYLLAAPKRIEEGELVSDTTVGHGDRFHARHVRFRDRRLRPSFR